MQTIFIFIIDRSGSMSTYGGPGHTKMSKVNEALCYFLKNLPPTAQYKIMSYGSKCEWFTMDDGGEEGFPRSTFFAANKAETAKICSIIE